MATDPLGGVVMFGGRGLRNQLLAETQVWNGSSWTMLAPPESPPKRSEMGMTYDPMLNEVVLWGGLASGKPTFTYYNDTWLFDGTTWTQVFPATEPPGRADMVMSYDSTLGEVVMYGGFTSAHPRWKDDTWAFDGTNWTQLTTTPNPERRADAGMGDLPAAGGPVLFGGWDYQPAPFDDTWLFDGTSWVQLSPTSAPSPRGDMVTDYFPTLQGIVLFGGQLKPITYGDTWTFDGTNWSELFPENSPSARVESGFAFDATQQVMVLFGGIETNATDSNVTLGDTWTFDGITWTPVA